MAATGIFSLSGKHEASFVPEFFRCHRWFFSHGSFRSGVSSSEGY